MLYIKYIKIVYNLRKIRLKEKFIREISSNLPFFFKAVRKFYGFQQVEFSKRLLVSQSTISKIETGQMLPDLAVWFRFIIEFSIKDPYCLYYDGFELDESIFVEKNFNFHLIPQLNEKSIQTIPVKKILPIHNFLLGHHYSSYLAFLRREDIPKVVFYIFNHPLPVSFAKNLINFYKDNMLDTGPDWSVVLEVTAGL